MEKIFANRYNQLSNRIYFYFIKKKRNILSKLKG